jgi:hypothetical protein
VEFTTVEVSGAPTFRLRYGALGDGRLKVVFTIRPPEQSSLQPIAVGALQRSKP